MSRTLELNCWVLGNDVNSVFPVEIAGTRSVGTLKESIREKKWKTFEHVEADTIELWKVSVLADDNLQEAVRNRGLDSDGVKPLPSVKRLSGLYNDALPAEGHVHIVIRRPPNVLSYQPQPAVRILKLNCWVLSSAMNSVFTVEIQDSKNVSILKDAIKEKKKPDFDHVPADALVLWNVTASIVVDRNLEQQVLDLDLEQEEPLSPVANLLEIFPDPLISKNLHVVIRAPLVASPASIVHEVPGSKDVLTLRRAYLDNKPSKAPSALGQPSEFKKEQNRSERAIYCNRPPEASHPIPVTLLHPVFGHFIDETQNLEPTAEDNELVRELAIAMSNFHNSEKDRADKVREILKIGKIGLSKTGIERTSFSTDGDMQQDDFRYIIAEMKNEIGSAGAEPYAQASLYYLESTRNQALAHPGSVIPAILVLVFGPYMAFAGAAWTTRPNVQVLSTAMPFHYHTSDDMSQTRAARHIGALKNAAKRLRKYYEDEVTTATETKKANECQVYPYPRMFQSLQDSREVPIEYVSEMKGGNLVFLCRLSEDHKVCVKFARRYCKEAHELCAQENFAPKLLGYEMMPGGWHMVVMEHLGDDYMEFQQSKMKSHEIVEEFMEKIGKLHQAGYVHGDIRDTNMMVPQSGEGGMKLVDFDWAGEEGRVRYPANVRRGPELWRPAGATDNELIMTAHDIAMLLFNFNLLQRFIAEPWHFMSGLFDLAVSPSEWWSDHPEVQVEMESQAPENLPANRSPSIVELLGRMDISDDPGPELQSLNPDDFWASHSDMNISIGTPSKAGQVYSWDDFLASHSQEQEAQELREEETVVQHQCHMQEYTALEEEEEEEEGFIHSYQKEEEEESDNEAACPEIHPHLFFRQEEEEEEEEEEEAALRGEVLLEPMCVSHRNTFENDRNETRNENFGKEPVFEFGHFDFGENDQQETWNNDFDVPAWTKQIPVPVTKSGQDQSRRRLTNVSLLSSCEQEYTREPSSELILPEKCLQILQEAQTTVVDNPVSERQVLTSVHQRRLTDISFLSSEQEQDTVPPSVYLDVLRKQCPVSSSRYRSCSRSRSRSTTPSSRQGSYQASIPEIAPPQNHSLLSSSEGGEDEQLDSLIPIQTHSQEYKSVFSQPTLWAVSIEKLQSLQPGEWVSGSIMNMYMLTKWYKSLDEYPCYFVDIFNTSGNAKPVQEEVERFWLLHLHRQHNEPLVIKPVVFVVLRSNHYFTVCFDYTKMTAWVFGKSINVPSQVLLEGTHGCNWFGWEGSKYWFKIASLFQWQVTLPPERIQTCNFPQNGKDCGPIAISIAADIMKFGLDRYQNGLPEQECAHVTRKKLLDCVLEHSYACYRWWSSSSKEQFPEKPSDAVIRVVSEGLQSNLCCMNITLKLSNIHARCKICRKRGSSRVKKAGKDKQPQLDESSSDSSPDQGSEYDPYDYVSSHTNQDRDQNQHHLTIMRGCRDRSEVKPRVPKFTPTSIPLPVQRYNPPCSHSDQFDDYYTGPTIEDLMEYPAYCDNFPSQNPMAAPVVRSSWEYFKDYGYRILTDFAVTFNQQEPIKVPEHLLPVGHPVPVPVPLDQDRSHSRKGPAYLVGDAQSLSMSEMLEIAGERGSSDSVRAFVCGKTPDDDYIFLRPDLDSVELEQEEVHINLDIDSVIWVTHNIRVLSSLNLHVLPYIKRRAPISKNNQAAVEILWPQTEEDREEEKRTEWLTQAVPLSQIPHIPFAQIGDGTGSFNWLVFFPRMKHKNRLSGRWATLIPIEVQNLWISEVVLPAIRQVAQVGIKEYVDFTLDEWRWKSIVNGKSVTHKTITLDADSIPVIIKKMRELVNAKPLELAPYGSFFFVLDARGIKLSTINIGNREQNPYLTLQKEYPSLDWEYMMLRENGQLLLDLGISFHPSPKSGQPLIGLWKLNHSMASYESAGMNIPQVYHCCTLANYGGLQAKMGSVRNRSVQLPFRSSYSLIFESVRRPGQEEGFCADIEAYEMSRVFKETCKNFIKIYNSSESKSYGVREEIRGSGFSINEAIEVALEKAALYLDSKPILWLPSEILSRFLGRRIFEIQTMQTKLFKEPPPNYGILTSILMHLLRNTPFATPPKKTYLKNALNALNYDSVIQRFGMFFLHDLDVESGTLHSISQEDGPDVENAIGINRPRLKQTKGRHIPVNSVPNFSFPLGETPTWTEVRDCLKRNPKLLFKPWVWNDAWDVDSETSDLFVNFTTDLWLALDESALTKGCPEVNTLQDAMKLWTVDYVERTFLSVSFIPNAHGFDHKVNQSWSFKGLFDTFFLDPEVSIPKNSAWNSFRGHGYLKKFSSLKDSLDPRAFDNLKSNLKILLSKVQCLPYSRQPNNKSSGTLWRASRGTVDMLTNPKYYKIKKLGKGRKAKGRKAEGNAGRMRVNIHHSEISARLDQSHLGLTERDIRREKRNANRSTQEASRSVKSRVQPTRNRNRNRNHSEKETSTTEVKESNIESDYDGDEDDDADYDDLDKN